MASEKAKELARQQKAAAKAEKLRKKNSNDPKDWGRMRQFVEAYKRTQEVDPSTRWWMIGASVGVLALIVGLGAWGGLAWWASVPLGLMSAVLASMLVLTRKAKTSMITRYKGQPGAAEVALQLLNKRKFAYQMGIAANRELDLVHRVIGPGGIVLIGEGQAGRTRKLLASEAQRHGQVVYGLTITQIVVGDADNQVPLDKLQKKIEKLPKVMQPHEIVDLKARLKALDSRKAAPVPKGPMPTPKGINRALRGR